MPSTEIATVDADLGSALEQFRAAMGADAPIPGLDAVAPEDLALPIISIDHKEAVFVDKLTGATYPEIQGVLLGMLKQRVMWDPDTGQNSKGLECKSNDGNFGNPREGFPWDVYKQHGGLANPGTDHIECKSCYFAEWGSGKNNTPACSLQHVYPLIVGDGENITGLLTIQRSAIKPSNAYLSGFVRDATPMFTAKTKITLNKNKQGSVDYCVPAFQRLGTSTTDVAVWQKWAAEFEHIKTLVQGSGVVGSDTKSAVVKDGNVIDADVEPTDTATPAAKF